MQSSLLSDSLGVKKRPPKTGGLSLTGFTPLDPSFKGIGEVYPLGLEILVKGKASTLGRLSLTGFTLVELMIVVIIIGVLAGLAVPGFLRVQERSRVREAEVALRLIRAAERVYQGEWGGYYGPDGDFSAGGTANTALRLDLNDGGANPSWDYDITNPGGAATTFTATATRTSGAYGLPVPACVYEIDQATPDPAPQVAGDCP